MYKIQIKAKDKEPYPPAPENVKQWEDLVDMPEFKVLDDAVVWLYLNKMTILESLGFLFQIIPVEGE